MIHTTSVYVDQDNFTYFHTPVRYTYPNLHYKMYNTMDLQYYQYLQ